MIRNIERIRYCGVFNDYYKPAEIQDFLEVNFIYGWNYCGKTTLSRIFNCLERNTIPDSLKTAQFRLNRENADPITHDGIEQLDLDVRVFNSDFIEENLKWNGDDFNPILLLGDESIDAVEEIAKNNILLDRCRRGYRDKSNKITAITKSTDEQTKNTAKRIRQELGITGAFNATHLNKLIALIKGNPQSHFLESSEISKYRTLVLTNLSDKKALLQHISLQSSLATEIKSTAELLRRSPKAKNAIQHLVENGDIARWIKDGLTLHKDKTNCEYCKNEISESRKIELQSHFSRDLKIFENELHQQKHKIRSHILTYTAIHESAIQNDLSNEFKTSQHELTLVVNAANAIINILEQELDRKISDPFTPIELPEQDLKHESALKELVQTINKLIDLHNKSVSNFESEKIAALDNLKRHYSAEYYLDLTESGAENQCILLTKHQTTYLNIGNRLKENISNLEQTINKAQKGSTELNKYISKFLSDSKIKIMAVDIDGNDRFKLMRDNEVARNLSEGEKTAIAFSFFLCSLRQASELAKVIVYIDDPISSLDSNHIFQINAVIKEYFYVRDNDGKWILSVKQLFVSTHNFEFLGLLKELPINKNNRRSFYYISRVKPGESSFDNMPASIRNYSSEYQFLWSFIFNYSLAGDKSDITVLMSLPNAVRRFVELYTYSKIPSTHNTTVDDRAAALFGTEKSKRILKVLHYFSHANDIGRLAQNSDLICDIDNVVTDVIDLVKEDSLHYNALMESLPS